ncbi:MAG: hypothetical protein LQ338_005347 [Usnochroma carphineum]|nr:MAG: hypothetical protein LQ338_005347 [Usnochroma carphineum]
MPSATLPTLSADEIDDLLYLARINDAHDLRAGIDTIAQAQRTSPSKIITAAVDPDSGNSLLHMASANGCMDVLQSLFPSPPPSSSAPRPDTAFNPNLQNSSGNTPLHWAALNGHLDAVKHLVNAGADPGIRNNAGHGAVYEAERCGKEEVVRWLLSEGRGLERGVGGDGGKMEEEEEVDVDDEGNREAELAEEKEKWEGNGKGVEDVQNGVAGMKVGEKRG